MYQSREYDRQLKHVGCVWWGSLTTLRWCGRIPTVRGTPRTMPNHDTIKGSTLRTKCTQAGISRDAFPDVYDNCWKWGGIPAKHELSDDFSRLPEKTRRIIRTSLKTAWRRSVPGKSGGGRKTCFPRRCCHLPASYLPKVYRVLRDRYERKGSYCPGDSPDRAGS